MEDNILDTIEDEWTNEELTENTIEIAVKPIELAQKEKKKTMLEHCQISVSIKDILNHTISEYGVDLFKATEDELVIWATRLCPSTKKDDIKDTAKVACEKNYRQQFFDTVIARHLQNNNLLRLGGGKEIYPNTKE